MLPVLIQAIETHGLPHWKSAFLALQKPSLRITTHLANNELPPGRSKIGGLPDFPPQLAWPRNSQRSLSFIAQMNLEEMPHKIIGIPMPETGILYFFYDIVDLPCAHEENGMQNWQVWYHPTTNDITPCNAPPDIADDTDDITLLRPTLIRWEPEVTYPEWSSVVVWERIGKESKLHYDAVLDAIVAGNMASPHESSPIYHRCFGYPNIVQPVDMIEESMNALLPEKTEYSDWQLLFQIDSDTTNADTLWADNGRLYFWTLKQDMKKRRFDRTWLILQAY